MRIAGVSVGKVRKLAVDGDRNRTLATIELDREFAPLRADARAMLRQKTLLGETYVELTPGRAARHAAGGRPAGRRAGRPTPCSSTRSSTRSTRPRARRSAPGSSSSSKGIEGRGRDFNDALGTLPGFAADASDVLRVLDSQDAARCTGWSRTPASRSRR